MSVLSDRFSSPQRSDAAPPPSLPAPLAWIDSHRTTLIAVMMLVTAEAALGLAANDPALLLLYLVGLAGLGLAAITLLKPETAVLAMLFLLFTRLSDVYGPKGGLITVNQLLVVLFLAAMVLNRVLGRREPPLFDRVFGWMLGFGAAMALSAWAAPSRSTTIAELIAYLREVLILFVLLNLITTLAGFRLATWTLIVAGVLLSAAAGLYALTGYDLGGLARATTRHIAGAEFGSRLTGPVGDPNDFARLLITLVPLALYRAWDERHPLLRVVAFGAVSIIGLVIVMTYSRGGIVALVAVCGIAVLMQRVKPSHLLLAGAALTLVAAAAPASYWERLEAIGDLVGGGGASYSGGDSSLRERGSLLRVGLQIFQDHPVFGVGKGNYGYFYSHYAWRIDPALGSAALQAHSTPVQIGAETGVVGLVALAGIVIVAVYGVRQAKRRFAAAGERGGVMLAEGVEIAIYGYVVASLFLSDSYPRYLWLMIGLAMIARQVSLHAIKPAEPSIRQQAVPAAPAASPSLSRPAVPPW